VGWAWRTGHLYDFVLVRQKWNGKRDKTFGMP